MPHRNEVFFRPSITGIRRNARGSGKSTRQRRHIAHPAVFQGGERSNPIIFTPRHPFFYATEA